MINVSTITKTHVPALAQLRKLQNCMMYFHVPFQALSSVPLTCANDVTLENTCKGFLIPTHTHAYRSPAHHITLLWLVNIHKKQVKSKHLLVTHLCESALSNRSLQSTGSAICIISCCFFQGYLRNLDFPRFDKIVYIVNIFKPTWFRISLYVDLRKKKRKSVWFVNESFRKVVRGGSRDSIERTIRSRISKSA